MRPRSQTCRSEDAVGGHQTAALATAARQAVAVRLWHGRTRLHQGMAWPVTGEDRRGVGAVLVAIVHPRQAGPETCLSVEALLLPKPF